MMKKHDVERTHKKQRQTKTDRGKNKVAERVRESRKQQNKIGTEKCRERVQHYMYKVKLNKSSNSKQIKDNRMN